MCQQVLGEKAAFGAQLSAVCCLRRCCLSHAVVKNPDEKNSVHGEGPPSKVKERSLSDFS